MGAMQIKNHVKKDARKELFSTFFKCSLKNNPFPPLKIVQKGE